MYGTGIYRLGEVIDWGVQQGLVDKAGAWYGYKGDKISRAEERLRVSCSERRDCRRDRVRTSAAVVKRRAS